MSFKISVIIVNWNTKNLLINCVRSIRESSICDQIEIIVVDNASHDGSIEAIRSLFSNLIIIQNQVNEGFSKANNRGIKISTGEYICLINSDVTVEKDTIKNMKEFLEHTPSIGILGPKMLYPDGRFQISYRKLPSIWGILCNSIGLNIFFPKSRLFNPLFDYRGIENSITSVEALVGAFWMINKTVIDQTGYLDENFFFYAEDIDYCKRVTLSNFLIIYFPKAQIYHHHGASSSSKPDAYYIEQQRANLFYWRKHYGVLLRQCVLVILIFNEFFRIFKALGLLLLPSRGAFAFGKLKKHLRCLFWLIFI